VVKPRFKHPSVILDHSSLVGVAAPDEATLIVEFSSRAAFSYSQNEWTNSPNMIFVTYTEGCGDYHNGERCYFVAGSIEFDLSTLLVSIQGGAVPLQDVTHDVNVVWGSFDDDGSDASGTFTSSGDTDPGPAPGYDVDTYPSSTSTVEPAFSPAPSLQSGGGDSCAPPDTIYGLPTACLGPRFDQALDRNLGSSDTSSFSFDSFVDAITLDSEENDDEYYSADDAEDEDYDFITDDDFDFDDNAVTTASDRSSTGSSIFGSSDIAKRAFHARHKRQSRVVRRGIADKVKSAAKTLASGVRKVSGVVVSAAKTIATTACKLRHFAPFSSKH
jgi:hypothetical protein